MVLENLVGDLVGGQPERADQIVPSRAWGITSGGGLGGLGSFVLGHLLDLGNLIFISHGWVSH